MIYHMPSSFMWATGNDREGNIVPQERENCWERD